MYDKIEDDMTQIYFIKGENRKNSKCGNVANRKRVQFHVSSSLFTKSIK